MNTTTKSSTLPVVFLHGFSGDQDGLRMFAAAYAGENAVLVNLPGFGGSEAPSLQVQQSIAAYTEATWQTIRKHVPDGPIHLVGHSHGAMMGFSIACMHPEAIQQLDLVAPVAMPRLLPRSLAHTLSSLARMGLGHHLLRFISWRPIVDAVTRYSLRDEWDEESRRRIIDTRRSESQYYSLVMFEVMQRAVLFMKTMQDNFCSVPTAIFYASDDNIAGARDYEWYKAHCRTVQLQIVRGGHLDVMAEPDRIAKELLVTKSGSTK